jgi:ATP-dependent DNA helicase 2 subunit 1
MSNAPKFATKRIFLITDNDDPTGGNPTFRKSSISRAKDLSHVGVEITLFGVDKPDNSFDTNLFYRVKKRSGNQVTNFF